MAYHLDSLPDELVVVVEKLEAEILSPTLGFDATHIKRIQLATFLAVQRFANGESTKIET